MLRQRTAVWREGALPEIAAWSKIQKLSMPTKLGNLGSVGKMGKDSYPEPLPSKPLNHGKLLKWAPFLSLHLRDLKGMLAFSSHPPLPLALSAPPSLQGTKPFISQLEIKVFKCRCLGEFMSARHGTISVPLPPCSPPPPHRQARIT